MSLEVLERKKIPKSLLQKEVRPSGKDSVVFENGGQVFKIYRPHVELETLKLYKAVTNKAHVLAEKENWEIKFQLIGLEIPMRVVSMDGLFYWEDEERFVAVSKLVRGRNLNQMNDVVDKRVVRGSLGSESLRLDRKLGVSGIQLDHVNIKETFSNGKRTLLVTDLCASIMKLREV